MRITFVLILLSTGLIFAENSYSQKAHVTIKQQKATLERILNEIENQTDYLFLYNGDEVDVMQNVSVNVKGKPVSDVLTQLFDGLAVRFVMEGRHIVLTRNGNRETATAMIDAAAAQPDILMSGNVKARNEIITRLTPVQQNKRITGTIVDRNGEPVIGASIIEKGTANGTVSNVDGKFILNISDNAVLQISYIGYTTQDVRVDNQNNLNIILAEDAKLLEEVVVVGYGTQKKVNLTGSVSTVNLETLGAKSRPVANAAQLINGAIPGLMTMQGSGEPNVEGFSIAIRGQGTLNSAGPLVIIDGLEAGIAGVNPSDIASVTILKDAASCAIYGNRGANGVILITTKNGSSDGNINITYDATFSYDEPFKTIHTVSDYASYMQLFNESQTNLGQNPTFSQSMIDTWNAAKKDPYGLAASGFPNYVAYPNTDWWREIYSKQWMQKHSVSVNGSSSKTGYTISFAFTDNPGVIKKTGFKRYDARVNLYSDVTNWLRVGTRLSGNTINKDLSSSGSSFFTDLFTTKMVPCTYPFYDGKYGAPENSADDPQSHNPLWDMAATYGYDEYLNLYTDWYASAKFLKYFTYNFDYYYSHDSRERKTNLSSIGKYSFSQNAYTTGADDPATLYTYMYYTRGKYHKTNHRLNYSQTFDSKHDMSALLGYEELSYQYRETNVSKRGLTDAAINDLNAATTPYNTAGYGADYTARSVFGRANYAFMSKYLLEANFRYDGSSRFAPDYRWGWFPSFSAGWRISEESWMKHVAPVSNLKIRASWGKLGNNSIGNYDWQSVYSVANYASGSALVPGIAITSIANGALQWEATAVTNIGVDYGLLNNRLTGSIDVYDKFTSGILYTPDMYMVMGNAAAPRQNIAEVTNSGIEVEIGWRDRIGKNFSYDVKANVAYNNNRVSKYKGKLLDDKSNLGDVSTGGVNRILEGHMINEWYLPGVYKGSGKGFDVDGINGGPVDGMIRTETDMTWLKAMQKAGYSFQPSNNIAKTNLWYGEYIYADSNGDGIYGNSYDSEFQGTNPTYPKYNFGLQASAYWKNIDFFMSWGGAAGITLYYYTQGRNSSQTIYGYAIPQIIADDHYFYDPDNPNDPRTNLTSKNARLAYNSSAPSAATSTLHLEKGDFIKLRNLTVGYTIPGFISKKVKMERFRVFVSGENLFAITGFSGLDPEQRTVLVYSTMRQYAAGINVTF